MNIIIEGMDGSGKSTLARIFHEELGFPIHHSGGPAKSAEEAEQRTLAFLSRRWTIFDRHICVSQTIYNKVRPEPIEIPPELVEEFYLSDPIIIFCRGPSGFHQKKENESEEHYNMVERNRARLEQYYREWAIERATFLYRWHQPLATHPYRLAKAAAAMLGRRVQ